VKLTPGDPIEVDVIKTIFDLYVNRGKGIKSVAKYLNDKKIPSPAKGKILTIKDTNGNYIKKKNPGLWGASIIHRIIIDEVYAGSIVYGLRKSGIFSRDENTWDDKLGHQFYHDPDNQIITKKAHEALIDNELFNKAQATRKQRNVFKPGMGGRILNSPYLLTGIIFCEKCGYKYTGWSPTYNGKKYFYYKDCSKQLNGMCDSKNIRKDLLDGFTIEKIKARMMDDYWKEKFRDRLQKKFKNTNNQIDDSVKIKNEIILLKSETDNLLEAIAVTGLTDQLKLALEKRQLKIKQLEDLKHRSSTTEKIDTDKIINSYLKLFDNMDSIFDEATNQEKKIFKKQKKFQNHLQSKKKTNTLKLTEKVITGNGLPISRLTAYHIIPTPVKPYMIPCPQQTVCTIL